MILEVRNLHKGFKNGLWRARRTPVLNGVRFDLERGETLGIVGGSGSGKTTIALILSGLLKPDRGTVRVSDAGSFMVPMSSGLYRAGFLQIVWQHPETAFNPRWKLLRSLREPLKIKGFPATREFLVERLETVHLPSGILDRYPNQVSGGELQRLALVRSLLLKPGVMILDEPTSMLDSLTQAQIIRLLENIQRENRMGFVFISHDRALSEFFCDRICVLEEGILHPE